MFEREKRKQNFVIKVKAYSISNSHSVIEAFDSVHTFLIVKVRYFFYVVIIFVNFKFVRITYIIFEQKKKKKIVTMGSSKSSEVKKEEKMVDSNGQINNNVIIQEAEDTHVQMLLNEKLLTATYILVSIELIKLCLYIFASYKKNLKKKYLKNKENKPREEA